MISRCYDSLKRSSGEWKEAYTFPSGVWRVAPKCGASMMCHVARELRRRFLRGANDTPLALDTQHSDTTRSLSLQKRARPLDPQTNNTQTIGSRHFSGNSADSHRFSNPRSTVLGVSYSSFITHPALFGPSARRWARHSLSNSVLGIIGSGLRTPTLSSLKAGHDTVYPTRSSETPPERRAEVINQPQRSHLPWFCPSCK